jgi:hypothetical protein
VRKTKAGTNKKLQISYEDFLAVLKEWEKYTSILFKEFAKDMPTSFEIDSYESQHIFVPFAKKINLSDLSELIWDSMRLGAKEVDVIHDDFFVDLQVDYFKRHFSRAEVIVSNMDHLAKHFQYYTDLDEPMKFFVELGKSAQLKIVQDGFIEIAVSNYEKAKQIVREREYVDESRHQEHLEINRANLRVKKNVRKLDNEQCVFCGRNYNYHSFDYLNEDGETFEEKNVFLSCNGCLSKRKKLKLEPKFGRFIRKGSEG